MFDYDYRDILYGDSCHRDFNETIIQTFINSLKIEESLIFFSANKYPSQHIVNKFFSGSKNYTETWYQTIYTQKSISPETFSALSKGNSDISDNLYVLRPPNKFISEENNVTLCQVNNNNTA